MDMFGNYFQTGDFKGEKHVPVIHAPESVKAGEPFDLKVSIGDAIAHPNTWEHHIAWFKVYFAADGAKFPVELAGFQFSAHGEGAGLCEPVGQTRVKLQKSGKIYAVSYCNIHGLWVSSADIAVL